MSSDNVPPDDLSPKIVWNENEENFLQNLLANTLLNDNLVEKSDFDLGIGFDNLQLNYDSSSTEPSSNQLTIVSLEEPLLDPSDLVSSQPFPIPDYKETDDNLFKKPSSEFLVLNDKHGKKKADLASTSNPDVTKSKRSFKRSRIFNKSNQEIILAKNGKNFKHRTINNGPSLSGQSFLKFNQPINSKLSKKNLKISSSKASNDSAIPKPANFDTEALAVNQSSTPKRDEFDLQIKELSLLDLHSSEDDSSHQEPNNKKIPLNSKKELINTKDGSLSEIIAKRIKFSQNSQEQAGQDGSNRCKQKLDKFLKYFRSLDSTEQEYSAKKSLDSVQSPPSPSSHKIQNKRKKKDAVESPSSPIVVISFEQPDVTNSAFSANLENDTLMHMKNLDLNTEEQADNGLSLDLKSKSSRSYLWNLLKENSSQEELTEYLGSSLHDKISFWDLVQLKLKYSKSNNLKTIYEIIDDYTKLYSNMSGLLERVVNEQSKINSLISKSDSSSRSRSASRNVKRPPSNSLNR